VFEFAVGDSRVSQGRTITEADILAWSGLVHDFTPLHVDAEASKAGFFGERIAHGSIALNLSVGLFFPSDRQWLTGFGSLRALGWQNARFTHPVRIGDTLRCRRTVVEIATPNPQSFVVTFDVEVYNQHDEPVMVGQERAGTRGAVLPPWPPEDRPLRRSDIAGTPPSDD
jgi:acyl dehydratase